MYTKTRTNLYRTTYHLVWVTKYRKVIFTTLNRREVMEDHIHLVVSFPPNKSISTVMKALKGASGFNSFQKQKKSFGRALYGQETISSVR